MLASPIGRYVFGTSALHKLDPRVKSIAFIVLIFSTALINTPAQLVALCVFAGALIALARLNITTVWASVRPILGFALIIGLFNLFVVRGGSTICTFGPLMITSSGIWAAVLYTVRLLIAVVFGALLLLTTTPTAITDAFESLLSPIAKLGLPVHEISMVFSLALRFVPILADETQSVIDAQAARGGSIEDGTLPERLHALAAIMVAVFAGALRHAQNLSRALDARCYEGGQQRSHYHEMRITPQDRAFALVCLVWLVAIVVIGRAI